MIRPRSQGHFKDFGFSFEGNGNCGKDLGRRVTSLDFIAAGSLAAVLSPAGSGRELGRDGGRARWI